MTRGPFGHLRRMLRAHLENRRTVRRWEKAGRPVPPPPRWKQNLVVRTGRDFRLRILIETGTYRGEMVEAARESFDRIVSIELDRELFEKARDRFSGDPLVTIVHGDSGLLLGTVLQEFQEPCLFWLDGHYSAGVTAKGERETPILEELGAICGHAVPGHVILIDDARLFTGRNDYPTLDGLRRFVLERRPGCSFAVEDDIIRIAPGEPKSSVS